MHVMGWLWPSVSRDGKLQVEKAKQHVQHKNEPTVHHTRVHTTKVRVQTTKVQQLQNGLTEYSACKTFVVKCDAHGCGLTL